MVCGGYSGGEVASNLAVFDVKKYIEENINNEMNEEQIKNILIKAIDEANKKICEKAEHSEEIEEMGTTLDICLFYKNKLYIGHIGDSRVYKISEQKIEQITTDHSYVQNLIKQGSISAEEANNHPRKHMLMKALGAQENSEPDILVKELKKGDIILMCTDGLTNMVKDDIILSTVLEDIENAPGKLIDTANLNGGFDNITIIIIENN